MCKKIAGAVVLVLALCFALCSCGPKEAPVTTAVSNPVSEYKTADELDGDVGFDVLMLPEETGFSPVAYQSIDHTLAEVVYGKDGEEEPAAQVTVRMAAGNENICGIYGIEDYGTELLQGVEVNMGEYNGVLVAWYSYEDYSYSLATTGVDVAVFEDLVEALTANMLDAGEK